VPLTFYASIVQQKSRRMLAKRVGMTNPILFVR